jgi:hypothetical protein
MILRGSLSKNRKRRFAMKKKFLAVTCGLCLLFAMGACKKKEEQPVPQTGVPGQEQQLPPGHPAMPEQGMTPQGMPQQGMPQQGMQPNVIIPKGETSVTVPDSVKGKWKAVVLTVENKETRKIADYTVGLHSDFKIPNSDLKITVGDFLPDFRMEGLTSTSASNVPNNPAVGIRIFEGGNQIFPAPGKKWGWLYTKFPTMHPFEHPKYAIVLKGAVPKG